MCDNALKNNFNIKGTRINVKDGQISISTGHKELDQLLGNGLILGTMMVVEEDTYGYYAEVMSKYYLAEGHISDHSIFLASCGKDPKKFFSSVPDVNKSEISEKKSNSSVQKQQDANNKLKIAWRYSDVSETFSSNLQSDFQIHDFDLTCKIKSDTLNDKEIEYWSPKEGNCMELLSKIKQFIETNDFLVSEVAKKKNLLRICINSLGNPQCSLLLPQFLYMLKCVLRASFATAFITIPTHLLNQNDIGTIRHIADYVIKLDEFAGTKLETNAILSQYHGYLHLLKLPSVNSIVPTNDLVHDYVFKLKRKSLVIEKLLLPPAIEEATENTCTEELF